MKITIHKKEEIQSHWEKVWTMKRLHESSIQVTHCDLHHIVVIIEERSEWEILSLNDHLSIDSIDFCFDNKPFKAISRTKSRYCSHTCTRCSVPLSINDLVQLKYFPICSVCISMTICRFAASKNTERDCCCACNLILFRQCAHAERSAKEGK